MSDIYESVIENVSDMGVKCYADPVENAHKLEIWAKSGDEEYIYKFIGPGVRVANIPMVDDCLNLAKENEKLKQENKKLKEAYEKLKQEKSKIPMVDDCLELSKEIEKLTFENAMLKKGNEKIKKEKEELKKDLQELQEAFPMTVNKILYGKGELKVENKDTDRVDKEPHTRADILEQAKKCVCGQREQDYGTPESNFQLIADLWNGYLGFLDNPQWQQIRATDVAMMMALLKIARIRNGGGSGDSFVDLAGYAACGGEIWDGERHKDE